MHPVAFSFIYQLINIIVLRFKSPAGNRFCAFQIFRSILTGRCGITVCKHFGAVVGNGTAYAWQRYDIPHVAFHLFRIGAGAGQKNTDAFFRPDLIGFAGKGAAKPVSAQP